jgi:LAS superfamily LD-carboxypeptidase LdcB
MERRVLCWQSMPLRRRTVLALGAALPFVARWAPDPPPPDLNALRAMVRGAVQRDGSAGVTQVFGLDVAVAADVLLRATKADALPDGFAPDDLVSAAALGIPQAGGQSIRELIAADTRALIAEATDAGLDLYVGSGFRSQRYQVAVFTAQVRRWGDEETANRYSAAPGHSQHQLGTTIDFTNTFAGFRTSAAADWLRDNAHRFGFVLPYTPASVTLTGYVDEPWHARWVGADLAARLQGLGYQTWPSLSADDVVDLVRTEAGLDV